jgi:hypothetical protein
MLNSPINLFSAVPNKLFANLISQAAITSLTRFSNPAIVQRLLQDKVE